MLREHIPEHMVRTLLAVLFPTPLHLLRNQIRIDDDRLRAIRHSVQTNYLGAGGVKVIIPEQRTSPTSSPTHMHGWSSIAG